MKGQLDVQAVHSAALEAGACDDSIGAPTRGGSEQDIDTEVGARLLLLLLLLLPKAKADHQAARGQHVRG